MIFLRRPLSTVVTFGFIAIFTAQSLPLYGAQASLLNLPEPGKMISLSAKFVPAYAKGISIYPNDPFRFDFIIDTGDTKLNDRQFKEEFNRLIEYFMAALTVPEKEDWVNLSPYEKDRIVPERLGVTEMGRDMLAQDYILKQLASSLIYPEKAIGKEFWSKVYAQAQKQFGTTNIPVNTFNKVWIVPSQAVVWEHDNSAYVVRSHLKVMLEQDYLSLNKHLNNNIFSGSGMDRQDAQATNAVSSNVVREVVLPALEKEVNEGANFAALRQVFNSAILAAWYKQNLKQSILGQVYANQNKVTGVDLADKQIKQKIYERYLQAFKKGAFNFIKEDNDPVSRRMVPRKYFSGGEFFGDLAQVTQMLRGPLAGLPREDQAAIAQENGSTNIVTVRMDAAQEAGEARSADAAMLMRADERKALASWVMSNLSAGNIKDLPEIMRKIEGTKTEEVVGGNWKMAVSTSKEVTTLIDGIASQLLDTGLNDLNVVIMVAPSFLHIPKVGELLEDWNRWSPHLIHLGAQDVSPNKPGAYTGDTSVEQLKDAGVEFVILGHSERRQTGETDQQINVKIKRALAGGLKVMLCIGETLTEREHGAAGMVLYRQIAADLKGVSPEQIENITIVYEPVWAIGTGKTPTAEQIRETHLFIRALLVRTFNDMRAAHVPVLYGGSMKPANAAGILALKNVGGGLISGASLKADDFNAIVRAGAERVKTDQAMVAWERLQNVPPDAAQVSTPVRVAVNGGSGRIGTNLLRAVLESRYDLDIVALNDMTFAAIKTEEDLDDFIRLINMEFSKSEARDVRNAHITGSKDEDGWWIQINTGERIRLISEPNPEKLPWEKLNIDVVYEATGRFTAPEKARLHLTAGAKKVVISAPSTDKVTTIVAGVNTEMLNANTNLCSAGSCTTGSIAPPLKVINDTFGIKNFYMVTTHSYTSDQAGQPLLRVGAQQRGMAAAENIIPTTTGAAKAIGLVLPALAGKGDGKANRVPTPNGSLTDITIITDRDVTVDEVKNALRNAANGSLRGIMAVVERDLTSSEILGRPESSIIQLNGTKVLGGRMVTIAVWYDNEFGFSNRAVDLGALLTKAGSRPGDTNYYRREIPPAIAAHINDDHTVLANPNVEGGINLDPGLYNMQVLRDGNGRMLPISQQPIGRFMRIKGFKPVLLHIERNINLPARLGVNLGKLPKKRLAPASSVTG